MSDRFFAPAVFALLVAATIAAFAAAQRLKREPLILDKVTLAPVVKGETVVSPNGDGCREAALITFRLSVDDRGTVEIIDREDRVVRALNADVINKKGRRVRTVVPGGTLPSYRTIAVRWNARDDDGRVVPTGPYRLRVRLSGEDRSLVPPGRIRVHDLSREPRPASTPACRKRA